MIDIVVGEPTAREVSPDLWGLFLEDINHCLDGGLNADLVRNGRFAFTAADGDGLDPLTAWRTLTDVGAAVAVRRDQPLTTAAPAHVRLDPGPDGRAAVINSGYDPEGMWFGERTARHRLRLAARTAGPGTAELVVAVVDDRGADPLAAGSITVTGSDWRWYELDLDVAVPGWGRLLLTTAGGSAVDLDAVGLRPCDPQTGEPELFRPDLVAALLALRPSFVRFPGGCLAHGLGLDNVYSWKRSVGPAHERRPMPNLWGYHQSLAVGYHEYFLLCEALGATPLPVLAAGTCCPNTPGGPQAVPLEELPALVQDVLDLVEYANGAVDTPWGARRAAAGHPEPFGLRYLALGNEDEITPAFEERFRVLAAAVADRHPDLELVGTAGPWPFGHDFDEGWRVARETGVALVDEHAYRTPQWFLQQLDRYDDVDRDGPGVYLGEWAARTNTTRSAIAEASFMIALERNGDVVRLASYAPLLARRDGTQWVPDLIYFDARSVTPSSSYEVQRLFGSYRGDRVCPVEVTGAEPSSQPSTPRVGTVTVRSPGSRVRWTAMRDGSGAGADRLSGPDGEPVGLDDLDASGSGVLELTATRESGVEGFVIEFAAPGSGTRWRMTVGGWQNRWLELAQIDHGIGHEIHGPLHFGGVRSGTPYRIRIECDGARIRCLIDDRVVHDVEVDLTPPPELVVGAVADTATGDRLVRIAHNADGTRPVRIRLAGASGPLSAVAHRVSGDDPAAGAPHEPAPTRTEEYPLSGHDGVVEVDVAPWSLTVLRIAAHSEA